MLTSQNQFIPNIATFNPNDFNGLLPSYQQQLVNTATTTATNSNKLAPNRNVLRSSPTARVSNGVHRSTYYNAVKNGAALVAAGRKQPTSDDLLYDYYSGIKPVPLLPLNMQAFKYNSKSSVEALEELCIKEGIPTPIYTLHTTSGYEPDGKEIGLFMYKVMIPNIFNATQLSSNRLMRSIDEAKNDAAEFVLTQIYSNPMQHQIQQSTLIPNELKNEQLTTPVTAVYQPNHQIQTVLNAANEPKSQTSAQSSINPNNGQYQDLSEYQPLLAPQPYIFDPTGQFLMCQTSE